MTRKEKIKDASWRYCSDQFNGNALRNAFQEGADWADKHLNYQYYKIDTCPKCKFVLFYNPCHNNYFVGNIDKYDNLIIDNEIQGKVYFFNHLYWTNLPKFDKNNINNNV